MYFYFLERLTNFLKQLGTAVFQQLLLKQEEILHLLGTIFSGGLIHIWCSSEYLQQQDCMCET